MERGNWEKPDNNAWSKERNNDSKVARKSFRGKVLLDSFPMNGHTSGVCPQNHLRFHAGSQRVKREGGSLSNIKHERVSVQSLELFGFQFSPVCQE